jgi:hypothetical protein
MAMAKTQKLKVDGRRRRNDDGKNPTTERHTIPMGSKTLTLIKYTKNSKTQSPYWQGKCFVEGRVFQKSTKEEDLKKAQKVAEIWMADLMTASKKGMPIINTPNRFTAVAESVLKRMDRSSGKSRHKEYGKNQRYIYNNYLYPHFKNVLVANITTPVLHKWMEKRVDDGMVSLDKEGLNKPTTKPALKRELMLMRMILRQAGEMGYIDRLPDMPTSTLREVEDGASIKQGDRIRFNSAEYKKLLQESRKQIKESKKKMDNNEQGNWSQTYYKRLYLHYFIIILANCGARTEEISGRLRHKDIRVIDKEKGKKLPEKKRHLIISISRESKTGARDSYVRYGGYFAYKKYCELLAPKHNPEDLLFPHTPRVGFRNLLIRANLREDTYGRRRDSKSLRHYFIQTCMARGNDIWDVSQQVGTSPQVIKDHYSRGYKASQYKEVMLDDSVINVD